jgi:hypothetical protein
MSQVMRSEMSGYEGDYASSADAANAVAEFSYRVGIAVVVGIVCMILLVFLRAALP